MENGKSKFLWFNHLFSFFHKLFLLIFINSYHFKSDLEWETRKYMIKSISWTFHILFNSLFFIIIKLYLLIFIAIYWLRIWFKMISRQKINHYYY